MLVENQLERESIPQQNCRVGRSYRKCVIGKLCSPRSDFDMVESCNECNKII